MRHLITALLFAIAAMDGPAQAQPASDFHSGTQVWTMSDRVWHTDGSSLDAATFGHSLPTALSAQAWLHLPGTFRGNAGGHPEALDADNIRGSGAPGHKAWALLLSGMLLLPALRHRCG